MPHTNYFPISLNIENRHCIVIGGGKVAARKAQSLLTNKGKVTVISPDLEETLSKLATSQSIQWIQRGYQKGDLTDAFLVIAATDDTKVQEAVFHEAEQHNLLLNVADVPKWCNFILPATVRRGDLTISISTAGKSPALAKRMRQALEKEYSDDHARLLEILGNLRPIVLQIGMPHEKNKILFENLLHQDMIKWVQEENWSALNEHVNATLGTEIPLRDILGERTS